MQNKKFAVEQKKLFFSCQLSHKQVVFSFEELPRKEGGLLDK